MTFIENLFFGNIDPQARAVKPGNQNQKKELLFFNCIILCL